MLSKRWRQITIFLCIFVCIITCGYGTVYAQDSKVFIGGEIVGFDVKLNGALVVGKYKVSTAVGEKTSNCSLVGGDLIVAAEGEMVSCSDDLAAVLKKCKGDSVKVAYSRNGEIKTEEIPFLIESVSNEKKLGLSVKDCITGLGTVTCMDSKGNFVALGHEIIDCDTGYLVASSSGKITKTRINGIKKGVKGKTGSIQGQLLAKNDGIITSCSSVGIKGVILACKNEEKFDLGNKNELVPGDAKICSSISGEKEYYDIKIIKKEVVSNKINKNFLFKVCDNRLLNLTGGVVQGMSGSPIIQNGKLVGAVTHVFVNDPTVGYGVYIENMLLNK